MKLSKEAKELLNNVDEERYKTDKKYRHRVDATRAMAGSIDSGGGSDPLLEALGLTKKQYEENKKTIDEMVKKVAPQYEKLSADAQNETRQIVADLIAKEAGVKDIPIPEFLAGYKSQAAGAKADRRAINAQLDALKQWRAQTTPELTAAERTMMEVNRREQEQSLRGQREAALANLQARGMAGGGGELAATLGAQQETAQRRMLEDLAARGQAVGRAQTALQQYGGLAGDIRQQSFGEQFQRGTAADEATRFGQNMQQQYNQWQTEEQRRQQAAEWGRTMDVSGARAAGTADVYRYGTEPARFEERAAGLKTGVGSEGTSAITSQLAQIYGARQAEEAARKLEKDPGLLGLGVNVGPFTL